MPGNLFELSQHRKTTALRTRASKTFRRSVGTLGLCLVTGCYTTSNTVTLTPLETKYPVSASDQYVSPRGDVVTEKGYNVVQAFEFERAIEAPRHETSETKLRLEPELDQLLKQHQGDAIVDLNVVATEYDAGSHGSAAGWKILGWTFGLTGVAFVVVGATSDSEVSGTMTTVGAVFAGLGGLGFLLSATTDDPAAWQLKVSGQVVRETSKPVEASDLDLTPRRGLQD